MLSEEWLQEDNTAALLDDIRQTVDKLKHDLVYMKDMREIHTTQGLIMAYMDVLYTIQNLQFINPKEEDEK